MLRPITPQGNSFYLKLIYKVLFLAKLTQAIYLNDIACARNGLYIRIKNSLIVQYDVSSGSSHLPPVWRRFLSQVKVFFSFFLVHLLFLLVES